ncbi:hypothetical protein Prum_007550 [Phytohabitans rumicis]|uniref:HTH marR-type domain-containing protein n=1 Tax=Phytohabitans rumicis TaxID=1076125 RepID=A0A6V8KPK4_9ACTN|nr:hypothetical protein Prum_007550 [Phytohabitans rumicis]
MEAKRATVRDLRRRNRAALLSRLYLDGPMSRHQLAGSTGLSPASVSNVIGEMIEQGLVEEAGAVDSDGGRPRALLRVRPAYGYLVGVDVGETRVRVELFDLAMTALAKADFPVDSARPAPDTVVRHILAGIETVTGAAGLDRGDLLGVGIGVPGVVEQGAEAVVHAQTLGWDAVPLEAMLRRGTDANLYVDNGAKTLGRAEQWFGAGRGARHVVVALVGSGVGAAVLAEGVSYRGVSSSAGSGATPRSCTAAGAAAAAPRAAWRRTSGPRVCWTGGGRRDAGGRCRAPTRSPASPRWWPPRTVPRWRPGCWRRPPATSAPASPT